MKKILVVGLVLGIALFIGTLVLSVILLPYLRRYIEVQGNSIIIMGNSMSPTLKDGQVAVLRHTTRPQRLDIVVFRYPLDPALKSVGRVVGMPGDRVAVRHGVVIINGTNLEEPYLTAPPAYDVAELQLTNDQLYILGDNRNDSTDSHVFGPVPLQNVSGVVTGVASSATPPIFMTPSRAPASRPSIKSASVQSSSLLCSSAVRPLSLQHPRAGMLPL